MRSRCVRSCLLYCREAVGPLRPGPRRRVRTVRAECRQAMEPADFDRRAANLAVFRFGADPARVQAACEAAQRAKVQGADCDLLDTLVRQQLLTPEQAGTLRLDLASTHFDPDPDAPPANGRRSKV